MDRTSNRPSSVKTSERLLWLSAVFTALFTISAYVGVLSFRISGGAVVSNFIVVTFVALCAVNLGLGRNWARWSMLVLFVLGLLMLPLALMIEPQLLELLPTPLIVFGSIQFTIQLAALVLAFTPASGTWFRPPTHLAA